MLPASQLPSLRSAPRLDRSGLVLRTLTILFLVAGLAGCMGDQQVLFSRLNERQANEVSAALLRMGIDVDKHQLDRSNDWSIRVGKRDLPNAMAILESAGLPRATHPSMGEIFKKEGFVASPTEDKARYLYALSEELSDTLQKIDGVISARVHVALPDRDLIGGKTESASASVVLVVAPGAHVQERETDIKAIVKDAVEGLDNPDRVTVKFFTRAAFEGADEPIAASSPSASSRSQNDLLRLATRSDVTRGLLIMFAGLTLLAALLLLWRGRTALVAFFSGRSSQGRRDDI